MHGSNDGRRRARGDPACRHTRQAHRRGEICGGGASGRAGQMPRLPACRDLREGVAQRADALRGRDEGGEESAGRTALEDGRGVPEVRRRRRGSRRRVRARPDIRRRYLSREILRREVVDERSGAPSKVQGCAGRWHRHGIRPAVQVSRDVLSGRRSSRSGAKATSLRSRATCSPK